MERYELPEGWEWKSLDEKEILIDIQLGFACGIQVAKTQRKLIKSVFKHVGDEYLSMFNCNENTNLINMGANPIKPEDVFSD